MKMQIILLILIVLLYSCEISDNTPDLTPCVEKEVAEETISGFLVFDKGDQEFGNAKGIKINEPFEATVTVAFKNTNFPPLKDSTLYVTLSTFWPESDGYSPAGEAIYLRDIPLFNNEQCYDVTNNSFSNSSISAQYEVLHGDTNILGYEVNESADNKFEIISFDTTTHKLVARLKVSFIADTALLPEFPKKVRFFNIDINHEY